MVYASRDPSSRNRTGRAYNLPLLFFAGWLICEYIPSFVPDGFSDDQYSVIYFLAEDLSTVLLASACYLSLSYTSLVLKGVSFSTIVISCSIMMFNIFVESGLVSPSSSFGLSLIAALIAVQYFMTRFIFRLEDGEICKPDPNTIYLIINKPHNFTGLCGLMWSAIGGGFSAYVDGDCYWFSHDKGILVKGSHPDWYRGKRMVNCGEATPEKISDLESLIGQKWSLWNNCFTVFSAWRRRWT